MFLYTKPHQTDNRDEYTGTAGFGKKAFYEWCGHPRQTDHLFHVQ